MTSSVFLQAKWQHLLMINYEIDPSVLKPFIPQGTELDLWDGKAFVSLVGFMFLDTQVRGISIPFHKNFEEVNLRFYIKRSAPEGDRRGVAFIKEIVPRWAIAYLARLLYNEKYVALPMNHSIKLLPNKVDVDYQWKENGSWQKIGIRCKGEPEFALEGSQAEFITEHYWGYSAQHDGTTLEYKVKHPQWLIWDADSTEVAVDVAGCYGPIFAPYLMKPPVSSFLALGSDIEVYEGVKLK